MSDYTYHVVAGGASAPNLALLRTAWDDFRATDRTGSGTAGIVAANSQLTFLTDGDIDHSGSSIDLNTIDTTTNTGAKVVIGSFSAAWNAALGRMGGVTGKDGYNCGANQFNLINFTRNLTIQDIVIRGGGNTTSPLVYGLVEALFQRCVIASSTAANAGAVRFDGFTGNTITSSLRNCLVLLTSTSQTGTPAAVTVTAPCAIDQCTIASMDATGIGAAFADGSGGPVVRNTYVGGFGATPWGGITWSGSCVGNAGDKTDTPNSGLQSIAKTTTNFLNVTSGSENFQVQTSSSLKTTGATRLAGTLTDAYSKSRLATTTIGAHAAEAVSGGFFRVGDLAAALSGLGSGGPFFQNPFARTTYGRALTALLRQNASSFVKRRSGIFVPTNYALQGA